MYRGTDLESTLSDRPLILIIDDNPENLRVAMDLLSSHGFMIRTARDGTRGLRRARVGQPHLILLDVQMPGIDGYETCRRLKADPELSQIPVIFMTALSDVQDKLRAFEAGGVDYVTKPFEAPELLARVRTHIELSRLQQALYMHNVQLEERVQERTRALQETNTALSLFLPDAFLASLGNHNILEVKLGDSVFGDYTVMFSDIRGFTTLSEALGPAGTFALINEYFGRMGPVITAHGGYISQYQGDGLLAIFPTPDAGVKAAIAQHHELEVFNAERSAEGLPALKVGIGLSTGPLTLGIIGDGRQLAPSLIGDTANLASRMEGLSKHYGVRVVLSDALCQRLAEEIPLRLLDRVRAKGRTEITAIYEALDADPPALQAQKRRILDSFSIGQEAERRGDFATAVKAFTDVIEILPEDVTARLWLERSARFLLHGRPEGWVMEPPK